jgi:hypothetical protein
MSEEKEAETAKEFDLQGVIQYQLLLNPKRFSYRSQVSSENNLASIMYVDKMLEHIIKSQKNPLLKKVDKIDKQEFEYVLKAKRLMEIYSERLAEALYDIHEKKGSQPTIPKIEIAQSMSNLRAEK